MQVEKGMCGCDTRNILNLVQLVSMGRTAYKAHRVGETHIIVHLD